MFPTYSDEEERSRTRGDVGWGEKGGWGVREVGGGGGGFNWGNHDSNYNHCSFTNNYY